MSPCEAALPLALPGRDLRSAEREGLLAAVAILFMAMAGGSSLGRESGGGGGAAGGCGAGAAVGAGAGGVAVVKALGGAGAKAVGTVGVAGLAAREVGLAARAGAEVGIAAHAAAGVTRTGAEVGLLGRAGVGAGAEIGAGAELGAARGVRLNPAVELPTGALTDDAAGARRLASSGATDAPRALGVTSSAGRLGGRELRRVGLRGVVQHVELARFPRLAQRYPEALQKQRAGKLLEFSLHNGEFLYDLGVALCESASDLCEGAPPPPR